MAGTDDHWRTGTAPMAGSGSGVLRRTVRNALVVIAMSLVVAAGLRYRADLLAVVGDGMTMPSPATARRAPTARQAPQGSREIMVRMGPRGHFQVGATVNGVPVGFLVDTGASKVILTLDDARRLGFDPALLDFSERYRTANGAVAGAPVTLRELRIGQLSLFDVAASVTRGPLATSLLGMSFLGRLEGYEVREGRLILRW